jgi:cytochrome c5
MLVAYLRPPRHLATFDCETVMRRVCLLMTSLLLLSCKQPEPQPAAGASSAAGQDRGSIQSRRLIAAANIALPPEGLTAASLPDSASRGAALTVEFCTQCHALPSPAAHGATDWPSVLRRMWLRIDMLHGELGVRIPSEAERTQVLSYVQAHALQVAENLPPGPGRDVYRERCSRCHLLPDPRNHSSADWPTVLTRMERNMERMKVSGITPDQAQAIITYLRGASRR